MIKECHTSQIQVFQMLFELAFIISINQNLHTKAIHFIMQKQLYSHGI
jgi:hypothetical protein